MSTLPDFQSLMRPLLEALVDEPLPAADLRARVANRLDLGDDLLKIMLPSGRSPVFSNRLAWANVYLQRAACVRRPRRGVYEITDRGRDLLRAESERIDMRTLARFSEFREWSGRHAGAEPAAASSNDIETDPEEQLETLIARMDVALEAELLGRLKAVHPQDFERMVRDLLAALGYGGGHVDRVQATPYVGDGGVDGIINEDALGLDKVYVQAKRYTDQHVGRPELQAFVGTLVGLNAHKGVFVTTSGFAGSAIEYARHVDRRIILIDGSKLAKLMEIGRAHV